MILGKHKRYDFEDIKKAIPLDEFVADIERRRQETGITEITRNAGNRRTASKRALLAAIKELGGEW